MARFKRSTDEENKFFREASEEKNTKTSTNTWVNVSNDWSKERGFDKKIYEYSPQEFDTVLLRFYILR